MGKRSVRSIACWHLTNPSECHEQLFSLIEPYLVPPMQHVPSLHSCDHRREFALHRTNDHDLHAYPFCRNHSTARRNASCTGRTLYPSSATAFSDEANIFFRPIFTASRVARGSLPRTRPVQNSSKHAYAYANPCGTCVVGEGSP